MQDLFFCVFVEVVVFFLKSLIVHTYVVKLLYHVYEKVVREFMMNVFIAGVIWIINLVKQRHDVCIFIYRH